jgi:hypothetical protein
LHSFFRAPAIQRVVRDEHRSQIIERGALGVGVDKAARPNFGQPAPQERHGISSPE